MKVLIKETLNIIKVSHKVPNNIIPLIEHYLTIIYFSCNCEFYEQTSETDSLISHIVTNIFMKHFMMKKLFTKHPTNQKFRYVNDTFIIYRHDIVNLINF